LPILRMIPVFISSPEEAHYERKAAIEAIHAFDRVLIKRFGVSLRAVDWHTFTPIAERSPTRSFQDRILEDIRPESIFVGIFGKKYGSPQGPQKISGTHEEIRFAMKHRDRIKIMQYFRNVPKKELEDSIVEDLFRIKAVKKEFHENNFAYHDYRNHHAFAKRIASDLLDAVLELIQESEAQRRENLLEFFRLGRTAPDNSPGVRIVCPQIHKHESGFSQPDYDWQERLLPNVIYEDFRAIEKIRTALRDIGIRDSVVQPPPLLVDGPEGNRIWLCIPRNTMAKRELEKLGNRVHFRMESVKGGRRAIYWTRGDQELIINSPLEKYLKLQRPAPTQDTQRMWNLEYGKMYGVDYAVLARFNVGTMDNRAHRSWPFFHYYFAGIRGLGTWGAGWYLDHHAEDLAKLSIETSEDGVSDLQVLLEVEYADYHIINVKDVSGQSAYYFNERYSHDYVREMSDRYNSGWE
jgi:hypothetical protein